MKVGTVLVRRTFINVWQPSIRIVEDEVDQREIGVGGEARQEVVSKLHRCHTVASAQQILNTDTECYVG